MDEETKKKVNLLAATFRMPGVKYDERPQKGAWAPGRYMCNCCHCKAKFYGDKRAVVCADCSYGEKAKPDAETKA